MRLDSIEPLVSLGGHRLTARTPQVQPDYRGELGYVLTLSTEATAVVAKCKQQKNKKEKRRGKN